MYAVQMQEDSIQSLTTFFDVVFHKDEQIVQP